MKGDELRPPAVFTGLIDLAARALGGRVLSATDDFFAAAENLVAPGRGQWIDDKYTEQGKWMDGWESRRRRGGGPCDQAMIALGAPGVVRGFDVDTNHFTGNHPAFAAIDVAEVAPGAVPDEAAWDEALPVTPLAGGAQNLLIAAHARRATHVRLRIYPDGGVARLRVYGDVAPHPTDGADVTDLAALVNGGKAVACSDMFFSPMSNAISPGDPSNMGGGWETRRRRGPGHDWLIIRLAARGTIERVCIDTLFFKGNYPDRASFFAVDAPGASTVTLVGPELQWQPLLSDAKLGPDARHQYEITGHSAPVSHVRLNIMPDGGVSRLRVFGRRAP